MPPRSRQSASSLQPPTAEGDNPAPVFISSHSAPHQASAMTTRSVAKLRRSSNDLFGTLHSTNAPDLMKTSSKRTRLPRTLTHLSRSEAVLASPYTASFPRPTYPATITDNKLHPKTQESIVLSPLNLEQVVNSSQSEEIELVMPLSTSYDLDQIKRNVQKWQEETFTSAASHGATEAVLPYSPSSSDFSFLPYHLRSVMASTVISENPLACLPSSSITETSPPPPPTPQPLDGDANAAQLISDIKARTFASANASSDEELLQYRELDASDDDLDPASTTLSGIHGGAPTIPSPTTVFSSSDAPFLRPHPCCVVTQPPLRPPRTCSRAHKRAPSCSSKPTTIRDSTRDAPLGRYKKKNNPLDALLREKRAADERGTSFAAFRHAETSITTSLRSTFNNVSNVSPDSLGLLNEQAAWRAIQDSHNFQCSTSPADQVVVEAAVLNETTVYESVPRKGMGKILVGNKADNGIEVGAVERGKAVGITMWQTYSVNDMAMESTSMSADASFGGDSPVLGLIAQLYRSDDHAPLVLLLESGILIDVPPDLLQPFVSFIFTHGVFASPRTADALQNTLRDLCTSNKASIMLPFSCVTNTLIQLGANLSIFEKLGWSAHGTVQSRHLSNAVRCEVLRRLATAIKTIACATGFVSHEVSDVVLSIVLVGLDVSTSHALRMQLNHVIDAICMYNAKDLTTHCSLHEKILKFAFNLNPANKACLVSFFGSGSERTRHIAQWLAYSLLLSTTTPPTEQLPSLGPIIRFLSPLPESGELFDLACSTVNYEDLECYASILAVALADITQYVREEHFLAQQAGVAFIEGHSAKKPIAPLETLRNALEVIQGKIVDTRAAHLDRSRTKAALQRLALRVHYERLAIRGMAMHGHASTLQNWLLPRS